MANHKITGTLHYVTGYTGFNSTVAEEQEGNYLALKFAPTPTDAEVTVELVGGTKGPVKLTYQDDIFRVFRITDKAKQSIKVTSTYKDTQVVDTYDLSGLTLEAKPAPAPTLGALNVTASAVTDGKTTLTVPAAEGNNLQRYKVTAANTKPTVAYDTVCATADGWTDIPADKAVAGTAGQVVTVVELTNSGTKARKKGEVTLA